MLPETFQDHNETQIENYLKVLEMHQKRRGIIKLKTDKLVEKIRMRQTLRRDPYLAKTIEKVLDNIKDEMRKVRG